MKVNGIEVYGVIYKITNKINGKVYIGQTTVGFDRRYGYNLLSKTHNEHLKRSIEKYGIENFDICKVYDIALTPNELDEKEIYYINKFDCIENGYNKVIGGATTYTAKEYNASSRKVVCLNDRKEYNTIRDASEFYNIPSSTKISACCRNKRRSCGKIGDTKLVFRYLEDYEKMTEKDIIECIERANEKLKGGKHPRAKKVICLNTKEVFEFVGDAENKYNINRSDIVSCCKGKLKSAGKINGEKATWKFYDDYLLMSNDEVENNVGQADNSQTK